MVIDVHTHIVPDKFPDMSQRKDGDSWPTNQCTDSSHRHVMISGKNFRTISNQCWSIDQRIEDMEKEGVTCQVLSPMPELLSYWLDAADALDFSRYMNTYIADMVQKAPNRFFGLGMVPLQDPDLAATEVKQLKKKFGLVGVQVGSNINGKAIGDPFFKPFFKAVSEEGIAVFVHSMHPTGSDRIVGPKSLEALIGFPNEQAFAAASLITGRVLEEFPEIRIGLSHGGGGFSAILPRLIHGWKTMADVAELITRNPMELAQKMYYDTLVYDDRTLNYLIEIFGEDRLMIGSDYPFQIRQLNPGTVIDGLQLKPETIRKITSENCLRFLGVNRG